MGSATQDHLLVLIIGAGPAGCAIAQGLKKNGISFKIFDKAKAAFRNRHWAFTVGWSRPFLLELLPEEWADRLTKCQVDPFIDCEKTGNDEIVIYNGATKEGEFTFPIPGAKEINMKKLRMMCAESIDVQYDKRLTHLEYDEDGAIVHFQDGTSVRGTVVVGVDGANSQMRRCLLPEAAATPDLLPFALMNFVASYTAEQALFIKAGIHPLVDIAIHPSGHYIRLNVLDMPDLDKPESWTFQILSTWPIKNVEDYDNDADRLKRLKAHVERDGWAEPYKTAIECIPEDTEILKDQLKIWKPSPWDNHGGRATLAGDAAHTMTFHRGQGANNAFRDAFVFVQAMKQVRSGECRLKEAVDAYDKDVVERGMKEVQISKSQTFFTHDWERFTTSPVMTMGTRPCTDVETADGASGK
ncbi:FAD/NAD(P)-binding domain-containing protein [Lepidopterella palustris CBS 459.81]|uniref:FAD/NAD(P)-binding domain-containing protein n=1 Tax=Lepidopterella palustris CBS 459.81 TaxID=1314670 RepID=A0A8E2ED59_9PEZI|nr:FAD/NAD(P)-binding domain-containing protein [Lepidopterella palustris CBS 459.81]